MSLLCNANTACERFKSAYVMKHFQNSIQILLKSVKEIIEKYLNCQKDSSRSSFLVNL